VSEADIRCLPFDSLRSRRVFMKDVIVSHGKRKLNSILGKRELPFVHCQSSFAKNIEVQGGAKKSKKKK
jgi:hypothetical protein